MASLDNKFSSVAFIPSEFKKSVDNGVSNKAIPNETITILNSLIKGESKFKDKFEDFMSRGKPQDSDNKFSNGYTFDGIMYSLFFYGKNLGVITGSGNIVWDGLEGIRDNIYTDNSFSHGFRIDYKGDLPNINDTRSLKNITINKHGKAYKLGNSTFKGIFDVDKISDSFFDAIENSNTSLTDNFNTPMGILYVFYKNIKRRSDALEGALRRQKIGGSSSTDKVYSVKPIDVIHDNELHDRKTRLRLNAKIQQYDSKTGSWVTLHEFKIIDMNFLYYKRDTYDLFINDGRDISFQTEKYKSPKSYEKGKTYSIECRYKDKVFKNCRILIIDIGLVETSTVDNTYPILNAYDEFIYIFNQYAGIRKTYLAANT